MPFENHYPLKSIRKINPDSDFKVKVMGIVVDKKDDTFVVDDGSGKTRVSLDESTLMEKIDVNQLLAVFGSTIPTENGFEIRADFVQDLSGLDVDLYKKVDGLYDKFGF